MSRRVSCGLLSVLLLALSSGGPARSSSSFSSGPFPQQPFASLPALTGDAARTELDRRGLSGSLGAALESARYAARPASDADDTVVVQNPAQHLRGVFAPDRAVVAGGGQQVTLRPVAIGFGDATFTLPAGIVTADGNRTEIARTVPGASGEPVRVDEWWMNRPSGLEHGFTVHAAPRARDAGAWLSVHLALDTTLSPRLADEDTVDFVDAAGTPRLRYDHLHVVDAAGRTLPARMRLDGRVLRLETDDAGAVYPVTIDPTWTQQAYMKASNTQSGDRFGWSLAIAGDTAVVGAVGEDSAATGVNGDQTSNGADSSGAAYVFVRTAGTWTQQAYLKASNTGTGDQFGWWVAMDGDTVVVGAPDEDSAATGINGDQTSNAAGASGAAYVFVRDAGTWTQQAYLKASNTGAGDQFGWSVAVDGDTVVVGAPSEDSAATGVNGDQSSNGADGSGAAYVFVRNAGTWTQQAYLKASNTGAMDQFGRSIAIAGDTAVVGANAEDSAATGVNGDQADNTASASGAAYVFVRNAGTWTQQAYLKASNTDANDQFGFSLAIDGDTVVVGAFQEASAATGVNGDQTSDALFGAGAAYVFVRNAGTWTQQAYLKASNTGVDQFGRSVAIVGDTVVVGANAEASAATGINGNQMSDAADSAGAAYVFARDAGTWTQQVYLKASNTGALDEFGYAVAMAGNTVVVGAQTEDSAATGINGNQASNTAADAGAAYVFLVTRPPDAPTIGLATAGNGQATVAFTAPADDGGSAITGYTATSSPGNLTGTLTQAGSGTITVTGLTNGVTYTFTVTATNAEGTSAASAASNAVTPATVPGAPTIGVATAGNGQASVPFTAPSSNGGSAITSYTATSSPGGRTGTLTQAGSGTITVTGLTNGTAYTFTVTATNAVGTSAPSAASNSVTPATVPGAPAIGVATAGSAQASVRFTAPASNGGSAITDYTVTAWPGGATTMGAASPIVVTGLTNGTAYTFTVTATNAAGTSAASAASNAVTPKSPASVMAGLGRYPANGGWMARREEPNRDAATRWRHLPWSAYNAANGMTRVAAGNLDGDPFDEVVVGLGDGGGGRLAVLDDATADHALLTWLEVAWPVYNQTTGGGTWPAIGDLDGDGRGEIVVGLGQGGQGWVQVFDDQTGGFASLGWRQLEWSGYNEAYGETHPAVADLDGDGQAEIILGTGAGGSGYLEVFDGMAPFTHRAWLRVDWDAYNTDINGPTFPAAGDLDGDGKAEIVIGMGAGSGGWLQVVDDASTGYASLPWLLVQWDDYNAYNGETHPAIGELDDDAGPEIAIGLGDMPGQGGWIYLLDDAARAHRPLAWLPLDWRDYVVNGGPTFPAIGRFR